MGNETLGDAKKAKNDEFYTQYADIEKEMNAYLEYNPDAFRGKTVLLPCDDPEWSNFTKYFAQNFDTFGLNRLISTSYAPNSKPTGISYQPTLFELDSPEFDEAKTQANGKIFTLTRDKTGDGVIDVEDLEWAYLEGDGDFRSEEIKALRDEADIIITNPPFSLFREFLNWIVEADKHFVILGNMNAVTYKEVFPLIKNNQMWLGATRSGVGSMYFHIFDDAPKKTGQIVDEQGKVLQTIGNSAWFTNIEHGIRHKKLELMSMSDNMKFSKHQGVKGGYAKYDNYDAIEVPRVEAVPSDFDGVMGVPITFLGKYNPDQFEILGMCENGDLYGLKTKTYTTAECKRAYMDKFGKQGTYDLNASGVVIQNGILEKVYQRILIRHRKAGK
ncbi:adenine-specific methyltransferase EcoRI family protein [Aurantimicrobium minutum]|uniref:adenine-specific methyltransferase EcoRI family protein n=1 Tax=Aurantimicrobium minutum TaxID=708131 RepID=UPI002475113A|nr:adenine-specific methyltransferase EcoRI family protein [Aurantimicrobium minutum]MDH6240127.1 hypothetical protein [Aurantimicrobium minutum]